MKTTSILAIGATVAALGLGGMAVAQSRPNTSNQPIGYGADSGELTNTAVSLRGRAEIQQGQTRLRANAIEGARDASGGLTRIEASGDVYYVTPNETIRGDRAVYTVTNATVVVTGDVILTQGQNVLTGGSLTYNVDTGEARIQGGGAGANDGRVRGVFYPEGSN
ncbi:LptA/OstA family protein [Brevundimonas subvibrioides]|uniref:OstA family protein n=1 Tax=Brevundimonas subvibrioides (strain ATCC 15264 / DSM 4735 / LMG 14903 / NBRC 16000 / CB 81) TaxID=633149 RepID=D9QM02_BRESC|nr:LptA/OstA family protein [Brevundimonas subvibrioides]ADL00086.1 OstA family protein [Brevundimonas subvibrioides ATCC 15264]